MAKKPVKDELLDHDYDGIQELDNDLPPWWLWLFYFSIAWGLVYMIYYHVAGIGPSQQEEYLSEMQTAQAQMAAMEARSAPAVPFSAYTDEANLSAGKEVYMGQCFPCHGQYGEGGIGPNLTDTYWIHGGEVSDLIRTVTVGVPAKGMIAWKPILSDMQIKQVASYILSLQGTNPPNAKAPEGENVGQL